MSGCSDKDEALWLASKVLEHDPNRKARGVVHSAGGDWCRLLQRCESPIEERLLIHVLGAVGWGHDVETQVPVETDAGSYRIDLAVIVRDYDDHGKLKRTERIAIECDGHDFHERTKEQAQRDKARDRALGRAGWHVLRFTGSEIWRAPEKCAGEVDSLSDRLWTGSAEGSSNAE